ncbi:hypothetical protein [Marinomonas fungiae]|uniref:hypothetical protein n=1 Tax=Marinomonas fungiae TaxID=1137284 RepID=UPI003A8E404B
MRLPTREQIELFNKATSEAEFARQHAAWMALKQAGKLDELIANEQMNTQRVVMLNLRQQCPLVTHSIGIWSKCFA